MLPQYKLPDGLDHNGNNRLPNNYSSGQHHPLIHEISKFRINNKNNLMFHHCCLKYLKEATRQVYGKKYFSKLRGTTKNQTSSTISASQ
jgi:hypothetical protein